MIEKKGHGELNISHPGHGHGTEQTCLKMWRRIQSS